jgi:hypothetical protein
MASAQGAVELISLAVPHIARLSDVDEMTVIGVAVGRCSCSATG